MFVFFVITIFDNFEFCSNSIRIGDFDVPLGFQPGRPMTSSQNLLFLESGESECLTSSCFESQKFCHVENDPCQNGGKCISLFNSYICECTEDFTGKNCEKFAICRGIVCENGECDR